MRRPPVRYAVYRTTVFLAALLTVSACADGQMPAFLQPKDTGGEVVARASTSGGRTTERDIEAPEIFQTSEAGLWDGRPSLGGVWVAHPDVKDPERVIIRNEQDGNFVIGALFRRERQSPGPRLQVSSDAAAALGMLAGQPVNLNVVALKREEVAVEPDLPTEAAALAPVPAAPEVSEGALDPVVSGAAKAIDNAAPAPAEAAAAAPESAVTAAAPAPKPKPAKLEKPFLQIGIFSIEQNAKNTATAMRQEGMVPTVKKQSSNGKTFWRVVVGPAQTADERATLLKKIKASGFTDAYAVTH